MTDEERRRKAWARLSIMHYRLRRMERLMRWLAAAVCAAAAGHGVTWFL